MEEASWKYKRLEALNKHLEEGQLRFSLRAASYFSVGTVLTLLIKGTSFHWILSYLWILYALYFIAAALLWSGLFDKALEVKIQLRGGKISKEKPASTLDYALCLSIFALLVLPPLAVKSAHMWFDRHPDASIVFFAPGDENPIPLTIPSAYVGPDSGDFFWMGTMGVPAKNVVLLTRLYEMQPLSIENRKKLRIEEYTQFSPAANYPELMEIKLMDTARFEQEKRRFKPPALDGDISQRLFPMEFMKYTPPKDENGLHISTTGNYLFATPLDSTKHDFILVCQRSCSLFTMIDKGIASEIVFHPSLLPQWRLLLTKSTNLIAGFTKTDA